MTEKDAIALLDTPCELRSQHEQRMLDTWLAAHPELAAEAKARDAALRSFAADFAVEPPAHTMASLKVRVVADREQASESFWQRLGKALMPMRWAAPALAAAAATLFMVYPANDPAPFTAKGVLGEVSPSVDLQISVELGDDGVVPASQHTVLEEEDGLIFRVETRGAPYVTLIERDPQHHFKVLQRWALDASAATHTLSVIDEDDHPLRYQPDGEPGVYTFLVVSSPAPLNWQAQTIDEVWSQWVERDLHDVIGAGGWTLDGMTLRFDPDGQLSAPTAREHQ